MALIAAHLNAGVILAVRPSESSVSLFPHLHTPFFPSLVSLAVSVDVKRHVYSRKDGGHVCGQSAIVPGT